jgi:hypothetical protein
MKFIGILILIPAYIGLGLAALIVVGAWPSNLQPTIVEAIGHGMAWYIGIPSLIGAVIGHVLLGPRKGKGIGRFSGLLIAILVLVMLGVIGFMVPQISKRKSTQEARQSVSRKEQRKDFFANIDNHYEKTLSFYKQKKFEQAAKEAKLFKKYSKLDYKDMESLYKRTMIASLEEKVRPIPSSRVSENLRLYQQLLELAPDNTRYQKKVAFYKAKQQEQLRKTSSDLELLSWGWRIEHRYAVFEGEVKNLSNRPLKNVQAVVMWHDANNKFIASDSALIEYNPIMPGQKSPYKVARKYDPLIKNAYISFKYLTGGRIPTYWKK